VKALAYIAAGVTLFYFAVMAPIHAALCLPIGVFGYSLLLVFGKKIKQIESDNQRSLF